MKILIKKLKNGEYVFHDEQTLEAIDIVEYNGNYKLDVVLEKSDNQLVLKNKVQVSYNTTCDRCLIEFVNNTTNKFELYYIFSGTNKEVLDDNTKYIDEESEFIDIANDVRDYIILSFPMQHLCKEDCKGICPKCGKDKNIEQCNCVDEVHNPIWDELKKLNLS